VFLLAVGVRQAHDRCRNTADNDGGCITGAPSFFLCEEGRGPSQIRVLTRINDEAGTRQPRHSNDTLYFQVNAHSAEVVIYDITTSLSLPSLPS